MRRLVVLAALGLAACGTPPEDHARDSGETVGGALRAIVAATDGETASTAVDDVVQARRDLDADVADAVGRDAQVMSDRLERAREDAAAIGAAVARDDALARLRDAALDARALAGALTSSGGSVRREFWRGVAAGFDG